MFVGSLPCHESGIHVSNLFFHLGVSRRLAREHFPRQLRHGLVGLYPFKQQGNVRQLLDDGNAESAVYPRIALASWVRLRIKRSRTLANTAAACSLTALADTNRIVGAGLGGGSAFRFPGSECRALWHSVRDLLGSFCLVITAGPGSATKPAPTARMGRVPRCAWRTPTAQIAGRRGEWGTITYRSRERLHQVLPRRLQAAIHSPRLTLGST